MAYSKDVRRPNAGKTVIIGLDGVPHSLLSDLIAKGVLNNLAEIFDQGYFGRMEVCIPEISSVSWSSFMTGTQSGEHGIFGFTDLVPNTYQLRFPNFHDLRVRTLFDEFGDHGKRCIVINLPSTYPAREIPGVLISGFVAIDLNKAIYPRTLIPKLQEMDYAIDVDVAKARNDHQFLLSDLDRTLNVRKNATEYLWDHEDWDLLMVVVTGTDRIHHFLWNAYENPDHPHHRDFIQYYQKVDEFVGVLYQRYRDLPGSADGMNHLMMLSDHGFTGVRSEINLNRWLQENGYLSFRNDPPSTIDDIADDTKAFAMDPSRIYIHQKGRYPRGTVEPGDVRRIKEEIRNGLLALENEDGKKILKNIYDRDELYHGPETEKGPDLVLLSHPGFDLKGKLNSGSVFDRTVLQGMHTQDDAFYYSDSSRPVKTIFDIKSRIVMKS